MSTSLGIINFDPSILLSYYQAQLSTAAVSASALSSSGATSTTSSSSSSKSATANDAPPWENLNPPSQQAQDAKVLGITNFLDLSSVPPLSGSTADAKTEQDNQKLFALYNAVNNLSYLASMSKRDGMTTGQLSGFNNRFQTGLQQVEQYISTATFNNFTLQAANPSPTTTSSVNVPFAQFGYTGDTIVSDTNVANALPGVSSSDSFTISVTKGGVKTDVAINLSQVQGGLSIDNIVNYVNQQLMADGFDTRFKRVITKGSINDVANASYGIEINAAPSESVSLSSAAATPSLYLAGTTGSTRATTDSPADNQGRLVKLTNLADPQGVFNATVAPDTGTTTGQSTVVDASGNVYMIGNATGNFGNQLNQGTQDVYLTKYDSAGNLQWTKLLGSAGSAAGYSMALNPNGGVVVAGSTTADLTTTAVANGNTDSFVAKYDANGTQTWVTQIQTLNQNQAAAVSVDASGNVYLGGQVTGVIGLGQTKVGGSDAYVAKLDSKGKLVSEQQFGTTANDTVAATAITATGDLVVASVQNGHAILSKYAGGDPTTAPVWQTDLGDLMNGGGIGGLAVSGNQIYVSGTTQNAALNAGGTATIAKVSSGGSDAFVFSATDNGTSLGAGTVSYVGTSGADTGGSLAIGSDGTAYLVGTTTGTFAGQVRNVSSVNNMFVAAVATNGSLTWTKQYGGADGQSTGQSIAIDPQGSSVLDALGLPRGTVDVNQTTDLTSATTLRAGDSFQIQIQGTAARTFTVNIEAGETLQSLVTKINADFGGSGKASIAYGANGEGLKIQVKTGVTAKLVAGPADFDALARLGLSAGTLSDGTSTSGTTAFGLGLGSNMDISTSSGGGAARAQLLNVLSSIRTIYQKTNAPATTASTTGQTGGSVSPYLQSQLSSYSLALNLLSASASGQTGSSGGGLIG